MVELFGLIDVQTISMVSAAIGVLAGVMNWIIRGRRAERQRQTEIETRQAQLFMQLYDKWSDIEFSKQRHEVWRMEWDDYEEFREKYNPYTNVEPWAAYNSTGRFYEGLGVLVHKKLIDISWVFDTMAEDVGYFWQKFEDYVKEAREHQVPEAWLFVEYLFNILRNNEAEIGGAFPNRRVVVTATSQQIDMPKHPVLIRRVN